MVMVTIKKNVNIIITIVYPLSTKEASTEKLKFEGACAFQSNWNFEVLVFVGEENWRIQRKNSQSSDKNKQQTQPTYGINIGIQTWTTLVGGECSHLCAIPNSQ